MLTMQLRELEQAEVLHRHVYAQVPPKVEYSLTELGRSLEPVILQLAAWGEWYYTQTGKERQLPARLRQKPEQLGDAEGIIAG